MALQAFWAFLKMALDGYALMYRSKFMTFTCNWWSPGVVWLLETKF
jgi:hypothetical protein